MGPDEALSLEGVEDVYELAGVWTVIIGLVRKLAAGLTP